MPKKKLSFNLLDVIIVLAIALLACGIIWRQELSRQIEQRDTQNAVEITCTATVTNTTQITEGKYDVTMAAGNKATMTKNRNDVDDITLTLSAVELESGFYLKDGSKLLVEETYIVRSRTAYIEIKIITINKIVEGD